MGPLFYITMGIILIIAVIVVLLVRSNWELKHFLVKKFQIDADVKMECHFVVISDLHNNEFGKDNEHLLNAIDNINPEFVCIAGDILTGSKNADNKVAAHFVASLAKKRKVYYGYGNHEGRMQNSTEEYGDAFERYLELISKYAKETQSADNIIFLNNKVNDLSEYNIRLLGLDIEPGYYNKIKRKEMNSEFIEYSLGLVDNSKYNILIAHHPRFFKAYSDYGADLVIAGHYHGGTVRMPGFGGCIATDFRLFPKFEKGMYKMKKTIMLVSGGLGTHTINVRLFNQPEVLEVVLKPREQV